jgi:hypothetical protein
LPEIQRISTFPVQSWVDTGPRLNPSPWGFSADRAQALALLGPMVRIADWSGLEWGPRLFSRRLDGLNGGDGLTGSLAASSIHLSHVRRRFLGIAPGSLRNHRGKSRKLSRLCAV